MGLCFSFRGLALDQSNTQTGKNSSTP